MKNQKTISFAAAAALLFTGISAGGVIVQGAETQEAGTYAFISKSMDNPYNFAMAEGFQEVIEEAGGECVVNHPLNPYADDQITIIDSLISQHVDAIAIAANDETRLTESLNEAKAAGIQIITLDSDTDHSARTTFCNQADTELIAQTMMDAVYDISGGEGEYAILSTTTYATNQNAWLEAHPDLKVICALTSSGITAAAKTISEAETSVKITGLGMPSELEAYIGTGEDAPCPYAYLWNPKDLGRLAASACLSLVSGEITGQAGESVEADSIEGSPFEITALPDDPEATEILLGSMTCFTPDNVSQWAEVF
ncbi:MAG TPA: substrate-binding domain-containing protein [Candidatus Blautia intestinipullorum]|nr:substrate-binding domain-containing protein [Candidatus Blautia intestinipullorum]